MNPEQQRIAIADACGWKLHSELDKTWCAPHQTDCPLVAELIPLPDYPNDLNAMHEAESFIRNAQAQMRYASETLIAMGFDDLVESSDLNVDYCWHAMGATAAQRAKAFLKTLNLWKP